MKKTPGEKHFVSRREFFFQVFIYRLPFLFFVAYAVHIGQSAGLILIVGNTVHVS